MDSLLLFIFFPSFLHSSYLLSVFSDCAENVYVRMDDSLLQTKSTYRYECKPELKYKMPKCVFAVFPPMGYQSKKNSKSVHHDKKKGVTDT